MRKQMTPVVAVAVLAIAAVGCGSSKKSSTAASSSSGATQTSTAAPKASGAMVALQKVSFGKVLAGPNGHTLYLFEKDKGATSKCTGACTGEWTPFSTSGQPRAGTGVAVARLGTTKRPDGTTQVTYAGHPLYYYADDKRPGQTEGEGSKEFGAEWYAVGAGGSKVEKPGS